jgi:hypothetical protein
MGFSRFQPATAEWNIKQQEVFQNLHREKEKKESSAMSPAVKIINLMCN